MQVIYLAQDNRFSVRVTAEACARFPEGSFNPGTGVPVYAMRIEGGGDETRTYFLLPAADGAFHWAPIADCRLSRR
jgi:hypothetical protein